MRHFGSFPVCTVPNKGSITEIILLSGAFVIKQNYGCSKPDGKKKYH
jgi:hypothetical protein